MKRSLLLLTACLAFIFQACTKVVPETGDSGKETVSSASEEASDTEKENEEEASGNAEETKGKTVTDHAGNTVELPDRIERIAVCDIYPLPSVISVFFDSADRIVGMAQPSMAAAKNSLLGELYPELLNAETGFIDGTSVNIEELLLLKPDLVFYNAGNKALGELLTQAEIPAVAFSAGKWGYDADETLAEWIATLDEIFGENEREAAVREYAEKTEALVEERLSALPDEERERVFFVFQYTESGLQTAGVPSFGDWWAEKIHADHVVTEKTEKNSLAVNMEQVNAWDPSVIFVTNFTEASAEDILNSTFGNDDWSGIRAVQDGRVYKMPLGMYRTYTSGADSPVALLWLAKAAYPSYFEDIDIVSETKAYYRTVFGIELTDEQADSIFDPPAAAGELGLKN